MDSFAAVVETVRAGDRIVKVRRFQITDAGRKVVRREHADYSSAKP